jgi:VanZ family protein
MSARSSPDAKPPERTVIFARMAAWAMTSAILIFTLVPPELRPTSGVPHAFEHFVPFLLLGAAFGWGYPQRRLRVIAFAIPAIAISEALQWFVPGRHARVSDFLVNAGAAAIGVVVVSLFARARSRASQLR